MYKYIYIYIYIYLYICLLSNAQQLSLEGCQITVCATANTQIEGDMFKVTQCKILKATNERKVADPETPKKAKHEGWFVLHRRSTIKAEREASEKAKAKATAADPETPKKAKKAKKAEASSREAEVSKKQETEETEKNHKEDRNLRRGLYYLMFVYIYIYMCIDNLWLTTSRVDKLCKFASHPFSTNQKNTISINQPSVITFYVYVYIYISKCVFSIGVCIYMYIHISIRIHLNIYIYIHMYIYVHVYSHAYIYIYIYA